MDDYENKRIAMVNGIISNTLLQSGGSGSGVAGMIVLLFYLAVLLVTIGGMWKVFTKAGQPGWAVIIPIYNVYVMLEIAERPWWWLLLFLIPIVSLIPSLIVPADISKHFGKGTLFAIGLIFLPFIFYPILGFSDATYQPSGA